MNPEQMPSPKKNVSEKSDLEQEVQEVPEEENLKLKEEAPLDGEEELYSGAKEMEKLNQKLEDEELPEEKRKEIFDKIVDYEEKLDVLQSELGLTDDEANEALTALYKGEIDVDSQLEEIKETMKSSGESGNVLEFAKKIMSVSNRTKKIVVAATILATVLIGSAGASFAGEIKTGSLEDLKVTNSIELSSKAGLASMKINSMGDKDAQNTWRILMVKAGMPKMNEITGDYIQRALQKVKIPQHQLNNLIDNL